MQRITPAEIDRVYGLVEGCLDRYAIFRDVAKRLRKAIWCADSDSLVDPPSKLAKEFKTAHEDLLAECRIVKLALANIEEFLHEHADEPVAVGSSSEPTCAEAIVASLPHELDLHGVDQRQGDQQLVWILDRYDLHHDYPAVEARAALKIERAGMRKAARDELGREVVNREGYWYFENGEVRFAGPLVGLRGQPRAIMRLLIERGDAGASWHDFNECLWSLREIDKQKVRKAVGGLYDQVRELDCDHLVGEIQPTGDGYRLVF